ncbi:MAG: hypothetical protein HYR55_11820 [Acidobacteria bacterium]|nr:hypothetical protein [Acidobacteriota bacterium]MBI3655854.1 hypothetical protein [Acidobacteriota bacterium]
MGTASHRSPKRILLIADANFLAHMSRLVEIAKVLKRAGHEVIVAGDGEFMFLPREEGIATDSVFTVARERTLELAERAGLVGYRWWRDTIYRSIRSDIECIERNAPDVVVGDMHWTLSASCRVTNVPYVSVTNGLWTNYSSAPLSAIAGHFSTKLLGEKLAGRILPAMKKWFGAYWALPYRQFQKEHNLTGRFNNLFDIVEGNLTLLADIPEYAPTKDLPPTMHYTGPILWNPKLPDPEWLARLDPRRPTLYFTMGSSGNPEFFREAIARFGNTHYQIIMTTGGFYTGNGAPPKNVFIARFANGLRLMEKSDIVINHGGNGTIYQAIAAGKPVIGIPTHVDQDINLQRVESLKFGLRVPPGRHAGRKLVEAIETILTCDSFRHKAQELQSCVLKYNGPVRAGQLIEKLLYALEKQKGPRMAARRPALREATG